MPERLTQRGWDRPYALTEYGPPGDWEAPRTAWDAPMEATSTAKVAGYRAAHDAIADDPRAVGGFAFLWGPAKQPRDTWYALFGPSVVPGGQRVRFAGVDALHELWTGDPPADRVPVVEGLITDVDGAVVDPGSPLVATLKATDPEGQPLSVDWLLHVDGGPGRPGEGPSGGGVVRCEEEGGSTVTWTAPEATGAYRVLALVRDPAGGAGYASARFHVGEPLGSGAPPQPKGLPIAVDGPFGPSGWMGDATVPGSVTMGDCPARPGLCQGVCRRFAYEPRNEGWAGVIWHHPNGNWEGEQQGLRIAKGRAAVTFTAWGGQGGERVTFVVGNRAVDGFEVKEEITLQPEPTAYTMRLPRRRHADVAYGFGWIASPGWGTQAVFHVADVQWESR